MSWLSWKKKSLDDVGEGADVRLVVFVASPDTLESALAPTRAAVFRWTLLTQHTGDGSYGATSERLSVLASGWRGGPLLVHASCGRRIEVQLDHAVLAAPVGPLDGTPIGSSPQSVQLYGAAAAASRSPVLVREHGLTHGQPLTLVGHVVRVASSGGYREAGVAHDVAFRTEGAITLEDHTLDQGA